MVNNVLKTTKNAIKTGSNILKPININIVKHKHMYTHSRIQPLNKHMHPQRVCISLEMSVNAELPRVLENPINSKQSIDTFDTFNFYLLSSFRALFI